MKILLFSGARRLFSASGLGRAILHQKRALEAMNVEYTENKNDDWDIVHINTYGPFSKRLAKQARKQGKAVVYHAHSTKEDFRNSFIGSNLTAPLFKRWIVSCYKHGDVVLTPSEYSKRLLIGYCITQPIISVSNGVDIPFYKPSAGDRNAFRTKYGYTDGDKVIMSAGMYFERKGILEFVKLAKEMPDYKFIWFGSTPLYTVPRKIRKAVKTNLPNLIFAGHINSDELKQAYVGADLFVFMSHEETEGIVLLEALAAGQNVIVRDIPVFEWLTDKKNVYKARDYEHFRQLAQDISEGRIKSLAAEGMTAVSEKSCDVIGRKLSEAYRLALKCRDGRTQKDPRG